MILTIFNVLLYQLLGLIVVSLLVRVMSLKQLFLSFQSCVIFTFLGYGIIKIIVAIIEVFK